MMFLNVSKLYNFKHFKFHVLLHCIYAKVSAKTKKTEKLPKNNHRLLLVVYMCRLYIKLPYLLFGSYS